MSLSQIAPFQRPSPTYSIYDRPVRQVRLGGCFSYPREGPSQPAPSVPPKEPAIARDIRAVAQEFLAIRHGLNAAMVAQQLQRVVPFVFMQDKLDTLNLIRALSEHPELFTAEKLRNIARATAAKADTLPAERRSMEFSSQTRASGDRRVKFVVSRSDVIDRHGTRIITSGIDLSNYRRNPIFLWSHAAWGFTTPDISDVIGKAVGFRQDDTLLELEVEFLSAAANPRAEQALRMVREGGLSATSVGFIPKEIVIEMQDEREVPTITKSELLEVSLVMVPSNPGVEVSGGRSKAN